MFASLLKYLPLFIILYSAYEIHLNWTEHQEILEGKQGAVPALQNRINRLKRDRKEVDTFMKDIESAKQRIEQVALEVETLQKKLPSNISDPENLSLFQGFADDLNVKGVSIIPGGEENNGFYFKKRYELKGSGTFLQFLILMEKISENERLLNIPAIKMYKDKNDRTRGRFQLIKAELSIEAYRYNPDHREDRNIEIPVKAPESTTPTEGQSAGEA